MECLELGTSHAQDVWAKSVSGMACFVVTSKLLSHAHTTFQNCKQIPIILYGLV